ncbi:MAG TPA: metal ABC transporter permease [Actinomycetota bacterium]|nr:metal ABC transporter permease [Actinomycetota bacterium]
MDPLSFDFFRTGLAAATLAGALCGLIGAYVVLRGMSYIGHGLSHAVFGGAVASSVLGVNFYAGAGAWGFASALLINQISRRRRVGADAAIGVVTTASFAIGLAIISRSRSFTRNFEAALFGSVLGVSGADVAVLGSIALAAGAFIFLCYRPLLFTAFDPEVAEASGVPSRTMDALFAVVLAACVAATMRVLGVTLVAAALVIPASTARLLTNSFSRMLRLSTGLGAVSGAAGMFLSYSLDVASGATIVLVAALIFAVVFTVTARPRIRRR